MSAKINFHIEGELDFKQPKKTLLRSTIAAIAKDENKHLGDVNIIFCSDEHLLGINNTFLKHNYYTDIITFDYGEHSKISGDIFISIDRISENSKQFNQSFENELTRVIFHGILHLCGYGDKSSDEVKIMRQNEEKYLKIFESFGKKRST